MISALDKSAFLLYLLLHRLERKQPTAIQFSPDWIFIFDRHGVDVRSAEDMDSVRLTDCWALADSNASLIEPCVAFQVHAERLVHTCLPSPDRWKTWIKQKEGKRIVSELPTLVEIAAIL